MTLNLKQSSISGRLTLLFVVLMVVILLAIALFLRTTLFSSLKNQMHNELAFRNSLVVPFIEHEGTTQLWGRVVRKLTTLTENEGGKVQYLVLSDDPLYTFGGEMEKAVAVHNPPEGYSSVYLHANSCPYYLLVKTIPAHGERPPVKFVVSIDSTAYYKTYTEFTEALIFISLAGLILVAALSYAVSRYGLKPARQMSEQANQLAPGNVGQRLNTASLPDELRTLAQAFNGVLERQEKAWQQLDSFNADVAHELRTPLTNLIGQTQLALSRQRDIHELEDLLESNLEELARMTSIINDMLFLSHAEAGQRAIELTDISLQEEAVKTAEYVEPSLLEHELVVTIGGDVRACVDRRLFHRALANLLENGARHASTGSAIGVSLSREGDFAKIAVSNQGDPIEPGHLSRLFERFYRVDAARNGSNMHHGLGLAIVKAVALMHDGKTFAYSYQGVNTFGFTLRLNTPHAQPLAGRGKTTVTPLGTDTAAT